MMEIKFRMNLLTEMIIFRNFCKLLTFSGIDILDGLHPISVYLNTFVGNTMSHESNGMQTYLKFCKIDLVQQFSSSACICFIYSS